jgi:cytochrome c biogenesis protein CcdA
MKFYLYMHQRTVLWASFALYLCLVIALLLSGHWILAVVTHAASGFSLAAFDEWCEAQQSQSEEGSPGLLEVIGTILSYITSTCLGPVFLIALDLLEHRKNITARQVISASEPPDDY